MMPPPDPAFWRNHAAWPLAGFLLVFGLIEILGLDRTIANAWYFDASTRHWLGTGRGDFLAHVLIHDAGRWVLRVFAAVALVLWLLSYKVASLSQWRRPVGFVLLAMTVSVVLVGLLKKSPTSTVPDLAGYGGENPYIRCSPIGLIAAARAMFPGRARLVGFALLCSILYCAIATGVQPGGRWRRSRWAWCFDRPGIAWRAFPLADLTSAAIVCAYSLRCTPGCLNRGRDELRASTPGCAAA
jgi:membrane-associated PAP2 superfamily phosphatase